MLSNSDVEQLGPEDDDPLFALCDEVNDENDPLFDMPSLADQAVANLHAIAPLPRVDSATVRTGINPSRVGMVTGVTDRRGSYQHSKTVDTCEGKTRDAGEPETEPVTGRRLGHHHYGLRVTSQLCRQTVCNWQALQAQLPFQYPFNGK
eukprot:1367053-Pleurochrysis_carterae.AAC.1